MVEDETRTEAAVDKPPPGPTEREPITIAELMQFMQDRHVKAECPQCGQNNWTRLPAPPGTTNLDNSTGVGLSITNDKSTVDLGGSYLPMLALMCLNCGYLRQFTWAIVEIWKHGRTKNG